jgi:hypothetical protein
MKSNDLTLVKNIPNAAKLISSLRHLDYTNLSAIADLVDNSIDAQASDIWIDILPKDNKIKSESDIGTIIISDNGQGMDTEILDEAMKLGSDTYKNSNYDLGLYGMGLITASISIGQRLEVITKTLGSSPLKSIQDLEIIYEMNEFVKILENASKDDLVYFEKNVINRTISKQQNTKSATADPQSITGTIVTLKKLDHLDYSTVTGFINVLTKEFGQIYRKFLQSGKIHIFIQGNELNAIDPIYDFEPNILNEEEFKFEEGTIKLTITEIKDYGQTINREKKINIPNQGFYVLRNNREILSGETLNVFTKHNDFNTLRIEFSYPGSLDNILSLNFSKRRISLNQSISDKIEKACNPFLKQIRKNAKSRQSEHAAKEEDFNEVEKYITQKSHLLKRPPAIIEERKPKTPSEQVRNLQNGEGSPRMDIIKRKRVTIDNLKVKFRNKELTERGPVYEADMEKDTVIIYWNINHPFYKLFIEKNLENPDTVYPIYFLVYSLGNAELISSIDSDTAEIITNIRYDVGRNLAVLLKD